MDSGFSPSEAAAHLGVATSTLRLYSARFASCLSEGAARPPPLGPNRPGTRRYTNVDLAVLARAKELLAGGHSYEQAVQTLGVGASGLKVRETDSPGTAALQQAMVAWRALAEERTREVSFLREELDAARAELGELRAQLQAHPPERHATPWSRLGQLFAGRA